MIFIVLLFFMLLQFRGTEECDFVKCTSSIHSYIFNLRFGKRPFTCSDISQLPECSNDCQNFLKLFENSSFATYCEENISHSKDINWSCIAKHTYRLLTCFASADSLTINNHREEVLYSESCRKYLEYEKCPEIYLKKNCGPKSSDIMTTIIHHVLNEHNSKCTKEERNASLQIPVYFQLGNDFIQAAAFLDAHPLEVKNCLTQLIQTESDLEDYLCGDYNPGIDRCINYELSKHGVSHPGVNVLLQKILSLAGLKCKSNLVFKFTNVSYSSKPNPTSSLKEFVNVLSYFEPKPSDTSSLKDDEDTVFYFLTSTTFINSSEKHVNSHSFNGCSIFDLSVHIIIFYIFYVYFLIIKLT